MLKEWLLPNLEDFRNFTPLNPNLTIRTRDVSQGNTIKTIVFHCTDAEGWTPMRLAQFFIDERKFPICSYHYYINQEKIFHMVGENIITYHAGIWNSDSVAFSIDFPSSMAEKLKINPDPKLMENAVKMATYLSLKFGVVPSNIKGHRELYLTGWFKNKSGDVELRKTCPGMMINLNEFRYEVTKNIQRTLNFMAINLQNYFIAVPKLLAVDGIFGPATAKAFNLVRNSLI